MTRSALDLALSQLATLLHMGWEFPDAMAKAATTQKVDSDKLRQAWDAECEKESRLIKSR